MFALLALMVLFCGCGYHLSSTAHSLPPDVRTVSVGPVENQSREFGLEKLLAFAFEREFLRRGVVRLVDDPTAGDAVLTGTIRTFEIYPVSFDANDEALQYQAVLVVDATLKRRDDGGVLWEVSGLRELEEYASSARVVVTSSSRFQRGRLNDADLTKLSDIQLAETEKRLAIERLVQAAARDVHDQIVEAF